MTIKSKDILKPPFADPKYLDDQRDLIMKSEGVQWANNIVMEARALRTSSGALGRPVSTITLSRRTRRGSPSSRSVPRFHIIPAALAS